MQGSYIDVHDNENVYLSVDKAEVKVGDKTQQPESEIPQVLAESELWKKVMAAGLVDADGQPTVSRTEAALLADLLARRLNIRNKWKMFEQLWHRNNMRGDYNTALDLKKSLEFQERLKKILS